MLELLQEYRENVRKEKEKRKAPQLLRSLTNDDDAELFTAILPDEDGNSPIHSDEEIYGIRKDLMQQLKRLEK